jgi:fluoride exporter
VSLAVVLGLGLLGGVGAIARFLLDGAVTSLTGRRFPWGTLAVNLSGAFALGVLAGAAVGGDALRLAGTGLLGAFTTFSTWAFESHRLGEDGELRWGVLNLLGSLALGIGAAWLGRELGAAL